MADQRDHPQRQGCQGSQTAKHGQKGKPKQLIIFSGLAGAGRTTALAVLSDLGFQATDALPPSLWPAVLAEAKGDRLAFGWPIASEAEPLPVLPDDVEVRHVFLTADNETLRRRYNEARRPHPKDKGEGLLEALARERSLAGPQQQVADTTIDTSGLKLAEFRAAIAALVEGQGQPVLFRCLSFSYRYGLPSDADMVFDMRWLRNPHYDAALRPKTGQDAAVGAYIEADEDFAAFDQSLKALVDTVCRRQQLEGKAYFTLAFGCTGGKHRSVFMAERLGRYLNDLKQRVQIQHRDCQPL